MIKAVIFDMDGLMIDSERITYEGYIEVCAKLGYEMTREFYVTLLGKPRNGIYSNFREHFGADVPIESIIDDVHKYMAHRFETEGVPKKPGLIELLIYLKENGYQTMVATSSTRKRVDRILEIADIVRYFDGVVCGDEVERGKPEPDIFLKACEKIGIDPEYAVVLEDSESGLHGAMRAGMKRICIPDMKFPQSPYKEMADEIFKDLFEVKNYLQAQSQR